MDKIKVGDTCEYCEKIMTQEDLDHIMEYEYHCYEEMEYNEYEIYGELENADSHPVETENKQ